MKYNICVKERYISETGKKKDDIIEDVVKVEVVGRYNSYCVYRMLKEYVRTKLCKEGSTFFIYLTYLNQKHHRVLVESSVCRGGLTADEYIGKVENFIAREVLDDKGLYHEREE